MDHTPIKPLNYDPCDYCAFCDACPSAHFFPYGYHECGDMRDMCKEVKQYETECYEDD